jgi:hypothetical protein
MMSDHTKSKHEEYFDLVSQSLMEFQFIEEAFRMYISYCYNIITNKVTGHIPFNFTYKDLEKDALGTLLWKFKKFSNNKKLAIKIEKLIKERNRCAHEAYLLTYEQRHSSAYFENEVEKLKSTIVQAKESLAELFKEVKHVEKVLNALNAKE